MSTITPTRRGFLGAAAQGAARKLTALGRELKELRELGDLGDLGDGAGLAREQHVAGHHLTPVATGPDAPVRQPYWIARAVVTNVQYARFVAATGATPPRYWAGGQDLTTIAALPVTCVSGPEAKAYCRWLNLRAPGWRLRLPTAPERAHADGTLSGGAGDPGALAPAEWTSTPGEDDDRGRRCALVHGGHAAARAFDAGHLGVAIRLIATRRV